MGLHASKCCQHFANLQLEDRQNTQYSTEKRNEQIIYDDELSDLMKMQANNMFRRTLSCSRQRSN